MADVFCHAGRSRKAAAVDAETESSWDWDQGKQHVLAAVRDLITLVDLKALFKGLSAAQQVINLCMELVSTVFLLDQHSSSLSGNIESLICTCRNASYDMQISYA